MVKISFAGTTQNMAKTASNLSKIENFDTANGGPGKNQ
jgi:hypothetical protein